MQQVHIIRYKLSRHLNCSIKRLFPCKADFLSETLYFYAFDHI